MDIVKRSFFGGVYVVLMLGALLLDSSWLYLSVLAVLSFIGICEYSVLVEVNRTRPLRTILDGVAVAYLIFAVYAWLFEPSLQTLGAKLFAPYLFYVCYTAVRAIYSDRELQPTEIAKIFFGQIYLGLGLISAHLLANVGGQFEPSLYLLLALVGIWANDTGAFLAGVTLGRHRLFPSVSPKKSWEGFFGGMLLTMIVVWAVARYMGLEQALWQTICYGMVISVAATWGDLFESMLKRQAGVKDSGKIIPGHGGVLDRIDSILFVLPALVLLLLIIQ